MIFFYEKSFYYPRKTRGKGLSNGRDVMGRCLSAALSDSDRQFLKLFFMSKFL